MKRIMIAATVAALFTSVNVKAQDIKNDGNTSAQADTIIIRSTGNSSDRKHVHLDFDIPFYNKIKNVPSGSALVGIFGIGSIFTDSKAPFEFAPQNSLEYYFYSLASNTKGSSTFSFGPGFTFRNLALSGSSAMSMADDGPIQLGAFPSGVVPKVSKLRMFSVNFPILYSYDFGGGFGFTLGPVVNFNTGSSIINKFNIDGEKQKDKYKNAHCNIVTVDAMFQLNLKYFSLYVKYSPMNLMDSKYWPEFRTWTIGIAPF